MAGAGTQMDNQQTAAIFSVMENSKTDVSIKGADRHAVSRRRFFSSLATTSCVFLTQAGTAMATSYTSPNALKLEDSLQSVLRSVGSAACIAAADKLAATPSDHETLSLHLRSADITSDSALRIADALAGVSQAERSRLGSFSLSYNNIGDDGAIALAAALPRTLGGLGLVGCSISDPGANALLRWAENASGLRMICIENNNLSEKMRRRFLQLRSTSSDLQVYV